MEVLKTIVVSLVISVIVNLIYVWRHYYKFGRNSINTESNVRFYAEIEPIKRVLDNTERDYNIMLIKKKELKPVAVFNDVEMFLQSDTFEGSEYLASVVKDFQRIRIDTDDEHVERFYDTPEGINAVLTQQYAIPTKPRFCALTGPIRIYKIEHLTSLWNEVK